MIDFRYHLVSLISVFLALAVGIALGAGPLKESIGDTLTGQVDQLRTERAALRTDLEATAADLTHAEEALAAVAPELVAGVLEGRRVAVVEVGEVDGDVREQVVAQLVQADAAVSATVRVTEAWTDPDRLAFRETLAGQLVDDLDPAPPADAGTGTELAEALAQGLTTAAQDDPDALAESAAVTLDLLREGDLIAVDGDVRAPADAVVLIAGPTVSGAEARQEDEALRSQAPDEADAARERLDAQLGAAMQISVALQQRSEGAVVAGGDLVDPSLVQRLRADDETARLVSTVESVQRVSGQVAVPLALAQRIGGAVGHFGTSESATAAMPPRVVLPPVERGDTPSDGAGTADGETTDGTTSDQTGSDEGGSADAGTSDGEG